MRRLLESILLAEPQMSKSNNRPPTERFHFPNSASLWHDQSRTESLGCHECHFKDQCGGLRVEAAAFDCLTYCRCLDKDTCDNICPRNAEHLVARLREIGGFDLLSVAGAPHIPAPTLVPTIPLIYHSSARTRAPESSVVALSLYEFFNKRDGILRFGSRRALVDRFKLAPDVRIVLTGTDHDPLLERWWSLADRRTLIRGLRELDISLITTPNYSLFDDLPRLDNLYNMKRIALVWSEFQREGLPCALHLNARTDRDWDRWIEFLKSRTEIDWVAFEFGTGAGAKSRIHWHVEHLCDVARKVRRPLRLVVRGGLNVIHSLRDSYEHVSFIDTTSFIKAQKRQRALLNNNKLDWEKSPTPIGAPIDDLLDANIEVIIAVTGGFSKPKAAISEAACLA